MRTLLSILVVALNVGNLFIIDVYERIFIRPFDPNKALTIFYFVYFFVFVVVVAIELVINRFLYVRECVIVSYFRIICRVLRHRWQSLLNFLNVCYELRCLRLSVMTFILVFNNKADIRSTSNSYTFKWSALVAFPSHSFHLFFDR